MTTDAITLPDLSLDRGRVGNVYRRGWGAGAGRTVPEGAHVPPAATNTVDWDAIVQGLRLACLYFDTDDADASEEIPYPRWPDGDPFPVAKVRAGYSAAVEAQQNAGHVQVSDAIAEIKRLREALEEAEEAMRFVHTSCATFPQEPQHIQNAAWRRIVDAITKARAALSKEDE